MYLQTALATDLHIPQQWWCLGQTLDKVKHPGFKWAYEGQKFTKSKGRCWVLGQH